MTLNLVLRRATSIATCYLLSSIAFTATASTLQNPLPGKGANAAFENAAEGPATVKVATNDGQLLLDRTLHKQTIENAKWTNDGKYLVMVGRNSDGHSPWRCIVAVFSVANREVRVLDDTKTNLPIINPKISCEGPDGVILTAHTFEHNKPAPDDPIKVTYSMNRVWPSLSPMSP